MKVNFLLRDRDARFTAGFDEVFKLFVGTCRREVLDHLLIFGRRHMERVLSEFIEHYHYARPRQGLGQRRPCEPTHEVRVLTGPVERRDRLGGLLHEYNRTA